MRISQLANSYTVKPYAQNEKLHIEPIDPKQTEFGNDQQQAGWDSEPEVSKSKEVEKFELPDLHQVIDYAQNALRADKSLIGTTSSLESLDITKVISNSQKDSVLQEYSFFVNDILQEDGFVIRKNAE